MAYVAPIHHPTSIRLAIRMQLIEGAQESLVTARVNRLQVWQVSSEGMTCLNTKVIFGSIVALQRLRPRTYGTDLLFVGTDRYEYFTLVWNSAKQQLETLQTLHDQSEPFMKDAQSINKCVVDPTGIFMVMHLWAGVINISRLKDRGEEKNIIRVLDQVRVPELFVKSSTFIYSQVGPQIAFLYRTRSDAEDAHLVIYKLTRDDKHNDASKFGESDKVTSVKLPDKMASMLIPVPIAQDEKRHQIRNAARKSAHLGGVLAVGETSVFYLDTQHFAQLDCYMREANMFITWTAYDSTRYFLADDFSCLHLLTLLTDGAEVTGVEVTKLGGHMPDGTEVTLSKALVLVHMGDGVLFLGSHHGDSQLLQVDVNANPKEAIKLVNSPPALSNNAPILDFVVMDLGNRDDAPQAGSSFSSGQARLVAGCGAQMDGSLRSIRSGVGLEDLGFMPEFKDVRGIFTLQSHMSEKADTLVVTSLLDTRIFSFHSDGSIEELDAFQGMLLDRETLIATNLPGGKVLQVTPDSALLLDAEHGVVLDSWNASDVTQGEEEMDLDCKVNKASHNGKGLLLALEGRMLVSLDLTDHLQAKVRSMGQTEDGDADQISCIHASSVNDGLGVVGFWKHQSVSIVDMKTLEPLQNVDLPSTEDSAVVPQDALLVQIYPPEVSGPTLLVSLDDGNVVVFNVVLDGVASIRVSGRRSVILGTHVARLHRLPGENGTSSVFVTTEHSTLIHAEHGRLLFSATTAEDVTYVAPFDAEAYPDSIVMATSSHIQIAEIDRERRTHVRTLKVNETVRRLAYSPTLKAFGLCCIQRDLEKNREVLTTSFKLADEILFQLLGKPHKFDCNGKVEMPQCVVRATLPDCHGDAAERFLVGTGIEYPDGRRDGPSGRIWVFGVDEKRSLRPLGTRELKSGCLCLAMMGRRVVAALRHSVCVYDYGEPEQQVSMKLLAMFRVTTYPVGIDVHDNIIAVADLMKSMSLVEFTPPSKGEKAKLVEVARHYQPSWSTGVRYVDERTWLETEVTGMLFVLQQKQTAISDYERAKLDLISAFNLGEQVNIIRTIDVTPDEDSIIVPRAFLGTVDGGVYLFGTINPKYMDLLMQFQSSLEKSVESPGDIPFSKYRAPSVEIDGVKKRLDEPMRFVDGELLERFLDMSEARQDVVCEGVGQTAEYMREIVEKLRRML